MKQAGRPDGLPVCSKDLIPGMKFKLLISAFVIGLAMNAAQAAEQMGSERHIAKGLTCESCHGKNMSVASPTIEQCKTCHQPSVVEAKTQKQGKQNPHRSPHYGNEMDCVMCHVQHSKPEDACAACHDFGFKVP